MRGRHGHRHGPDLGRGERRKSQVRRQGRGCLPGRFQFVELQLLGARGDHRAASLQGCDPGYGRGRWRLLQRGGMRFSGMRRRSLFREWMLPRYVQRRYQLCGVDPHWWKLQPGHDSVRGWRLLQLQFYDANLPGEGCCWSVLRCRERYRPVPGRVLLCGRGFQYRDLRQASRRRRNLLSHHVCKRLRFPSGFLRPNHSEMHPQDPAGWGLSLGRRLRRLGLLRFVRHLRGNGKGGRCLRQQRQQRQSYLSG